MSDEESFVILGTSPTPSMATLNSLPISQPEVSAKEEIAPVNGLNKNQLVADSRLITSSSSNISQYSLVHNGDGPNGNGKNDTDGEVLPDCTKISLNEQPLSNGLESCATSKPMKQSVGGASGGSGESSLAASFILGEVNSDVLKASVYSQFPSISMEACAEDVVKLQVLMSEYMELKKTLMSTNLTMKQLYDQTQKWKQDVKAMEENQKIEIAKLRNENYELRKDLEDKVKEWNINEEIRKKDFDDVVQKLSEKSAQVENMSAQIQKLEQQQLATFEFIPKNGADETQSKDLPEYVSFLEHKRVLNQLSEIVAQNLDLKDVQSQYIDEINCLKVNMVAAEELQKKAQADINMLKASDVEKSEIFAKFQEDITAKNVEIDVLRRQLDLYCKDFKIEQEARENVANEKDQLLSDLRLLQRKNQELIEEAQRNYEEHAKQMATTGAFPKPRVTQSVSTSSSSVSTSSSTANDVYYKHNCPLCGQMFKTLSVLQNHVNQCLDGN